MTTTMPIQGQLRRELIAALRSGAYQQGAGWLHPTRDTYCCLGVACDVYAKHSGDAWSENSFTDESPYPAFIIGHDRFLPQSVADAFGMDIAGTIGQFQIEGRRYRELTIANDEGQSFAAIADVLEAEWFPQDVETDNVPLAAGHGFGF